MTHSCRLSAEDVMSKDLKYLPLISQVETIDNLLRTTPHSAFPIAESSGSSKSKVPIFYRGKRLISEGSEDTSLEVSIASMYQSQRPVPSKHVQHPRDFTYAIRTPKEEGDGEEDNKQLVLHGLILRSQLVTLLKNNVFIDENEQV